MAKKVLLLDLGGVVVDLGDPAEEMELSISTEEFWRHWLVDAAARDFEIGKIAADEFFTRIGAPFRRPGDDFEERFRRWTLDPRPSVVAELARWSDEYHLAMLSNTNTVHWAGVRSSVDISPFDALFLSFEKGVAKPAPAAFIQVVKHYACDPGEVFFLDDSEENIDVARCIGMNAYLVRDEKDVLETVSAIFEQ